MIRRYPQLSMEAVLADMGHPTLKTAAQMLATSPRSLRLRCDEGMTVMQADRVAVRRGMHPSELWTCWYDVLELESEWLREAANAKNRRKYHRQKAAA